MKTNLTVPKNDEQWITRSAFWRNGFAIQSAQRKYNERLIFIASSKDMEVVKLAIV